MESPVPGLLLPGEKLPERAPYSRPVPESPDLSFQNRSCGLPPVARGEAGRKDSLQFSLQGPGHLRCLREAET